MRPVLSEVQPDDPAAIAAEIRRAARAADLVLVIAGSSAGRRDHTATALCMAGGLTVRGVAVRPGHPVLLGHTRLAQAGRVPSAVPVIGVPGYPLAAAVIFELFAVRCWPHSTMGTRNSPGGALGSPVTGPVPPTSRNGSRCLWPASRTVPLGAEKCLRGERIDVRPIAGSLP
jgi:molybdopterin biosynthesis enzyme